MIAPLVFVCITIAIPPVSASAQVASRSVTIEGTIKQFGTGVPLRGLLTWLEPGGVFRNVRSDGVGRFRVDIAVRSEVRVRAASPDHISEYKVFPIPEGNGLRFDFELEPAVSTSGHIVDSAGQPVSGALIRIVYPGEAPPPRDYEETGNVETDSLGRFYLPFVKSQGRFVLEILKPGLLPAHSQELTARGKPIANIVIPVQLRPGLTLSGRVVDDAGAPVEGAWVRFSYQADPSVAPSVARASQSETVRGGYTKVETGPDGRFSVSGLPAAPFRVLVAHPNGRYAPTRASYANVGEFSSQELLLTLKAKK
jgi:protocatechuate 3,4-dioxygenase beta subunit